MKLSKTHKIAIQALLNDIGGASGLIRLYSIPKPTAYKISSKGCKIIQSHNWDKIKDALEPYIVQAKATQQASDNPLKALIMKKLETIENEETLEKILALCLQANSNKE